jgi:hypothetical protein
MYVSVFRKKTIGVLVSILAVLMVLVGILMDGVEEVGDYFPGKCFLYT